MKSISWIQADERRLQREARRMERAAEIRANRLAGLASYSSTYMQTPEFWQSVWKDKR